MPRGWAYLFHLEAKGKKRARIGSLDIRGQLAAP